MSEIINIDPVLQANLNIITAFTKEVDLVVENCLKIKVDSEDSLAICQQNTSKTNTLLKKVEESVKLVRKPYNDSLKKISEISSPITDKLKSAVDYLKSQTSEWDKKQKEKAKVLEYINGKVTDSLKGFYERSTTVEKCDHNIKEIERQWPGPEKFGDLNDMAVALRDSYMELIRLQKEALMTNSDVNLHLIADKLMNTASDISKMVADNKSTSPVQVARGVRKTWAWEVPDISKVPLDWLCVDEDKVKEYLTAKRDSLIEGDVVNGVRFFKQQSITA
jgi:hypothetical protein